jgi:hypothetical protein
MLYVKEQCTFFTLDVHFAVMAHRMNFSHISSRERTHWLRDWVNPKTGLDVVAKRKITLLPGPELQASTFRHY